MIARYLLPLLLVPVLSSAQQAPRLHLNSKVAQERHLPFSSGVLVGTTLYLSGVTGVNPSTKGPVSPEEEARLVMDQLKQALEQAGMTMDDLVSVQVFCTDLSNYEAFNNVYKTYFRGDYPARAFLGASTLLFGARYEVIGTAVRSGNGEAPSPQK